MKERAQFTKYTCRRRFGAIAHRVTTHSANGGGGGYMPPKLRYWMWKINIIIFCIHTETTTLRSVDLSSTNRRARYCTISYFTTFSFQINVYHNIDVENSVGTRILYYGVLSAYIN